MQLSAVQRVMLSAAALAVTAGVAISVDAALEDDGPPTRSLTSRSTASRPALRVDADALAAELSQTSPLSMSPAPFDDDVLDLVATQQSVETDRAWPLEIPGDDRTAWLFVGPSRLALVVPRTVIGADGEPLPDSFSVFGTRLADLRDRPLVASQAGGGQDARTLVLVPEGVEPPRIVAQDGTESIREMPRSGRLYADRIRAGEQLVIGTRRLGPSGGESP